jgi:hypothetical protein
MPSAPPTIAGTDPNVDSVPSVPRLSPKISSFGRRAAGIAAHRPRTAVIRAAEASMTSERSVAKEIQLGRYEYCIDTSAVSPAYMNSSELVTAPSTQPVPVGMNTATTERSNAPVRSISRSTSRARSATESADCSPAYTRIGSRAGRPANRVSSARVGPRPAKSRPCRPSVCQGASEYGPPERSDDTGATTSSSVPSLATDARRSATANRFSITSVSTRPAVSRTTTRNPAQDATGSGVNRHSSTASRRPARRSARAMSSSTANAARLIRTIRNVYDVSSAAMPSRRRRSFCQRVPSSTNTVPATGAAVSTTHQPIRWARPRRSRRGTRAPTAYPVAAVMPLTTPCRNQARGSSDGVSEKQ